MEGRRVERHHANYTEAFNAACPAYMSMGMSWDEFWHGDPQMAAAFREADRIASRRRDQELWLQGRYVYDAMLAAAPLYQTFARSHRPRNYDEKPYTQMAEDAEREKELESRLANGKALAERLAGMIGGWQSRSNREGGQSGG